MRPNSITLASHFPLTSDAEPTHQGETQSDKTPNDDQQTGRPSGLLVAEQGLDVVQVQLFRFSTPSHLSLDLVVGVAGRSDKEQFALLQVFEGQIRDLAVLGSDGVDDFDGLGISAFTHEVLGGFLQVEAEESEDEHDHSESTHDKQLNGEQARQLATGGQEGLARCESHSRSTSIPCSRTWCMWQRLVHR